MSAFVVDKAHIDALVTAGLARFHHYGPLRWHSPEIGPEDQEAAYQRGEPWGPGSVRLTTAAATRHDRSELRRRLDRRPKRRRILEASRGWRLDESDRATIITAVSFGAGREGR